MSDDVKNEKRIKEKSNYFGNNLKFLREHFNKKQQDIANLLGKKNSTISNYESGFREPNAVELATIANYFGVSIGDLITTDLRLISGNLKLNQLEAEFNVYKKYFTDDDISTIRFFIDKVRIREENKKE